MEWENEASWVWVPDFNDAIDPGQFVLFRRTFKLTELPITPCLLRISADTRYRFYVNSESVSMGPCKSYLAKWYFEEVDISGCLRIGANVLSAKVLRFSASHMGNSSMARAAMPGLIAHCKIGDQLLSTDTAWKAMRDPSIQLAPRSEWDYAWGPPFLSLSERVDGTVAEEGWTTSKYSDEGWLNVEIRTAKLKMMPTLEPWRLNERPIPMLPELPKTFDTAVVAAGSNVTLDQWNAFLKVGSQIELSANKNYIVEVESSVLTTGFLQLACTAGAGTTFKITCAECYERPMDGGEPRFKSNRADFKGGKLYGPLDTYTTHSGDNYYEPFWFRTFRYVRLEIECGQQPTLLLGFSYRSIHYPLEIQTTVSASPELNDLWKISLNTLKNCMHETYEDCPYYEQNQFAMDSRIMMLLTYQLSLDDRLARKTLHEFYSSRRDDGLIETHFPVSVRCVNIPQFSLYWVLMVCDHFRYFRDLSLVKMYVGTIDGIFQHFDDRVNELGLVGRFDRETWPFIDWIGEWMEPGGLTSMGIPNTYKMHGAASYNSLAYAMSLNAAAELCDALGRKDTAAEYRLRARKLNEAVNKHCFDGSMYLDGPGVLESPGIQDRTSKLPKASFAMLFYAFRAASEVGAYDELYDKLIYPWREMLRNNMTTCAESDVLHRSDCHGWSAAPTYEVVAEILGVTAIVGQGDVRVRVAPRMSLQEKVEGTVVTQSGKITLSWDSREILRLKAHRNMNVQVVLRGKTEVVELAEGKVVSYNSKSCSG